MSLVIQFATRGGDVFALIEQTIGTYLISSEYLIFSSKNQIENVGDKHGDKNDRAGSERLFNVHQRDEIHQGNIDDQTSEERIAMRNDISGQVAMH